MATRPIARRTVVLASLALAGCVAAGNVPPGGYATLPADAVVGAGDPTRAAIINTAYVFGNPASVAGRPDAAARAVANFEYLAVELPYGPRWRGFSPLVATEFAQGQAELRPAIGIAPNAPAQPVVDALFAASRALQAGDRAAAERILSSPIFPAGGAATLQRLAALPMLPRANAATSLAASEMDRQDRQQQDRGGGAGGGGGRS
ncbi:hypothetical protein GCM10011504_36680 [Siccirubricoccus deserti]|uniref:Uncharacterized protein n=1 Tax=Siccirubricoccus deserti TaxID=2013562 RepID=A0A9X0UEV5_9PROT|nr:hypothetical protein [Siccirubricoccus deserti]MBC4018324.1 hypothetical protein [Siccirubricoccus deserti]GGC55039.1 hypothetical protein GCM10011504_36680 [Siccirubricoccus deserti]